MGPFTTKNYCPACLAEIKAKNKKDWTDIDIDLMVEYDVVTIGRVGLDRIQRNSYIEMAEDYRILREMDKTASLKLNTRFELLKGY
jgi:hypothetical protein